MKRRFRNLILVSLLAVTPLALAADRNERIRELSPKFICICGGCNQLLMNCNHIGCPSREAMLRELGRQIDQEKDNDSIVAFFMEKYGTAVLSAPPASGFNLTAWVMPFLALAIGAVAAIVLLRRFRTRFATADGPTADVGKYQQKLEEELKKFSPED